MSRCHGLLLLVLIVGCGNRDESPFGLAKPAPAGSQAAPAPSPVPAPIPTAAIGADWAKRKRIRQIVIVDGVPVSVDIPEGLPRDPGEPTDWNSQQPQHDAAPKVFMSTVEVRRIHSADDAKYHATLDARTKTWVRTEKRRDGWALTNAEPDQSVIEAITYLQADDLYVRCKATQRAEGPIPNHAAARALLESICDSSKLK